MHRNLEEKIATFHGREDAILYPSCFDANAGFFEVLLGEDDAVISDELNHASIIDGIRLCKASRYRYKNSDMKGNCCSMIWCAGILDIYVPLMFLLFIVDRSGRYFENLSTS